MQVAAGYWHTVGLKDDGTTVAVGDNYYSPCDVVGWTDIIHVAGGRRHTVGLRFDGTLVAAGDNVYGQCDVGGWDLFETFPASPPMTTEARAYRHCESPSIL